MNNSKFCTTCGAKNDIDAKFCENCSAEFNLNKTVVNLTPAYQSKTNVSQNIQQKPDLLNGVTDDELEMYVGTNSKGYMKSFDRFKEGKKASFSPLVFLMSLFISPLAGAYWFLHRKMYSIGTVVLCIALALTVGSTALVVSTVNDFSASSAESITDFADDNEEFYEVVDEDNVVHTLDYYLDIVKEDLLDDIKTDLSNAILSKIVLWCVVLALNIAFAVVVGIFAKYFYFKKAVKKISSIKEKNPNSLCLKKIRLAGGTACASWVVISVVVLFAVFGAVSFSIASSSGNIVDAVKVLMDGFEA